MATIHYRFNHELHTWYQIEIGASKIDVSSLKKQIAIDRRLIETSRRHATIRLTEEGSAREYNDSDTVAVGSRVIAHQVSLHQVENIKHDAKTHFTEADLKPKETEAVAKERVPEGYLCYVCKYVLINPVQLRCDGPCKGKLVCRIHAEKSPYGMNGICPFDGNPYRSSTPIPNKRMAQLLEGVDWEGFDYPKRSIYLSDQVEDASTAKVEAPPAPIKEESKEPPGVVPKPLDMAQYVGCFPKLSAPEFARIKRKQVSKKRKMELEANGRIRSDDCHASTSSGHKRAGESESERRERKKLKKEEKKRKKELEAR
eukprot:GHVN01015883.1.p1 GENE.GHVN01015883.1~~GHVN01015883.1.p1  ORF type:complete len:314 (-),score=32.99 GHVN01015883.1:251-1192(-)